MVFIHDLHLSWFDYMPGHVSFIITRSSQCLVSALSFTNCFLTVVVAHLSFFFFPLIDFDWRQVHCCFDYVM